jgi:malate dehydrogenase (oxaloacetate-decarboxylating)
MADKEAEAKERQRKADEPGRVAVRYHAYYRGKIEVIPRVPIESVDDFAVWYTPGVAEPCRSIVEDEDKAYDLTNRWNMVAVVTDGTRVLGLGPIGPLAGLPVMEGKALLFKYLGGVDAFPICLATKTEDDIVTAVKWLTPTFGGINLEDISQPKCFNILDRLRREATIPVWHDDQQGTATVTTAGLINALKVVGKKISKVKVAMIGAGAANIAIAHLLEVAGVDIRKVVMTDRTGILNSHRNDLEERFPQKWDIAKRSNREGVDGDDADAMKGADVVIASSRPGPGVISKEMVMSMAKDPIVFANANPVPEIWPWEAKEAGAKVVATGRSDFPNQVNNSLVFPAVFRGALDVRAKTITDGMTLAAAIDLARTAEKKGLSEDYILPIMTDTEAYLNEAVAVGLQAVKEGVARRKLKGDEIRDYASLMINRAQAEVAALMKEGVIRPLPR